MKLQGADFTNSRTCHGVSYVADEAPVDLAEITITGRYPERGWARNLESHEMMRVLSGSGRLLYSDGHEAGFTAGDVLHVPPMTWFAWDGDATILMATSPVFDPDKYKLKETSDE